MTADWSIWAFRYARSDMPRDFFGGTLVNSNKGRIRNLMVYSLIHGGEAGQEKPILIDTGMKGDWSPSGKTYENVEHPDTILAKVGFAPEDIEDVILTHLHFDHAGNLDRFPNARFHVQRAESPGPVITSMRISRSWRWVSIRKTFPICSVHRNSRSPSGGRCGSTIAP